MYVAMLNIIAAAYGIPKNLLPGVCYVESKLKPEAIAYHDGEGHSLGLCQIKLNTARLMGFKGTEEQLMDPKTNGEYAARYLHWQMKRYGNWTQAIIAYNSGSTTRLSNSYFRKVIDAWAMLDEN